EPALLHQKEFVLVLVPVSDERALELDELHVVSVHLPDDLRVPMGREQGELLRQVFSMRPPLVPLFVRQPARDPFRFVAPRPYHTPHSFTEYSVPSPRNRVTDANTLAGLST